MKKILFLSTDTLHHRYFINRLLLSNIDIELCIFEANKAEAPFAVGPLFKEEEDCFEREHFFKEIPEDITKDFVINIDTVNSRESFEMIQNFEPDLGIVFGTGLISTEVIGLFKDGLINVHRGVVSSYRGLDSDLWAIYHNDYNNIGVTIHKIDQFFDTGDVLCSQTLILKKEMRIYQVRYYTTIIATDLVLQTIHRYLNNDFAGKPQKKRGRYYSFMPIDLKKVVANKFNNYCKGIM